MTETDTNPPRIAQWLLHLVVPGQNADAVTGDLLEEYRVARRPYMTRIGADAWYVGHVLSIVARLVWPFALPLVGIRFALAAMNLFPLSRPWNPSLVPAPNVSLLDAAFFLAAGYYGAHRTGRTVTGVVNAGVLGVIDFAAFALCAVVMFPTLFAAIRDKPFILVIGCIFLAIAMAFALVLGTIGATMGSRSTTTTARTSSP